MSVQNFVLIHLVDAEIFLCLSENFDLLMALQERIHHQDSSPGHNECLYKISRRSKQILFRYFSPVLDKCWTDQLPNRFMFFKKPELFLNITTLSESKIVTLQNVKIAEAGIFEKLQRQNHKIYPATSSGKDNIRLLLLVCISVGIHSCRRKQQWAVQMPTTAATPLNCPQTEVSFLK